MKIEDMTASPPCGNPACKVPFTVRLVDIRPGAEVKCKACGAVNVLKPSADGVPSDPGGALRELQNSLVAFGGEPARDDKPGNAAPILDVTQAAPEVEPADERFIEAIFLVCRVGATDTTDHRPKGVCGSPSCETTAPARTSPLADVTLRAVPSTIGATSRRTRVGTDEDDLVRDVLCGVVARAGADIECCAIAGRA